MGNLSSNTFYGTWLEVVNTNKKELESKWGSNIDYTSFIIHEENSIICQIAEKLKLLCYNSDYYLLDSVLYNKEDLVPEIPKGKVWLRDIQVAFEHENTFRSGLYQEVAHLTIINAKLKVLVSYPEDTPHEELEYLHNIISNTRHAADLSKNESLLLVFGYKNGFAWEGFVFTRDKWKEIT